MIIIFPNSEGWNWKEPIKIHRVELFIACINSVAAIKKRKITLPSALIFEGEFYQNGDLKKGKITHPDGKIELVDKS